MMANKYDNLIIKYLMDLSTDSEERFLLNWIEESESNRDYFLSVHKVWLATYVNRQISDKEQSLSIDIYSQITNTPLVISKKSRYLWTISIAASIFLLVSSLFCYHYIFSDRAQRERALSETIITSSAPVLVLSDGTTVPLDGTLNSFGESGAKISQTDESLVYESGSAQIEKGKESIEIDKGSTSKEIKYNTIKIPTATVYSIVLSDGTKVWLNSESQLTYPVEFLEGDRVVSLKGEGYFEVSKSSEGSRFIVKTVSSKTSVFGTKFNVCDYGVGISSVTLAQGVVQVSLNNQNKSESSLNERTDYGVRLLPGEQALIPPYSDSLSNNSNIRVRSVDVDLYLSWIDGERWFFDTPLTELSTLLKRFYGITIECRCKNPDLLRFSGKLDKSCKPSEIIGLIAESATLSWGVEGDRVILTDR